MLSTNLDLIPPFRWAIIEEGIFRGAYPNLRNFRFLQRLQLNVIVSVIPEKPTKDLREFCDHENIRLIHFKAEKYKEESVSLTHEEVSEILAVLTDTRNHPLYIHCLDGAGVTGHIIMCLRKLQHWHRISYITEFNRLARDNASSEEKQFVEEYKEITLPHADYIPPWLWGGVPVTRHPTIRVGYHVFRQTEHPSNLSHQTAYSRHHQLSTSANSEIPQEEGAFLNRSFSVSGHVSKLDEIIEPSFQHSTSLAFTSSASSAITSPSSPPSSSSSSSSASSSSSRSKRSRRSKQNNMTDHNNHPQVLTPSSSYSSFFGKDGIQDSLISSDMTMNSSSRLNRREMLALNLESEEQFGKNELFSHLVQGKDDFKNNNNNNINININNNNTHLNNNNNHTNNSNNKNTSIIRRRSSSLSHVQHPFEMEDLNSLTQLQSKRKRKSSYSTSS